MRILLITLLLSMITIAQDSRESDSIALVKLHYQNKENTLNWDITEPIETWNGVTVHGGRVVGLQLSDKELKLIPLEFSLFTLSEGCDVSENKLFASTLHKEIVAWLKHNDADWNETQKNVLISMPSISVDEKVGIHTALYGLPGSTGKKQLYGVVDHRGNPLMQEAYQHQEMERMQRFSQQNHVPQNFSVVPVSTAIVR